MNHRTAPMSLAGSYLADTRHVCAFFGSDDEEYRALLPFMKDGIDRGDRAIHVVNPEQRDDHLRRLAAAGIDTAAAEERGQLELRTSTDTYLRDGRFDRDRMLAVLEQLASGSARKGFPRSRIVCRMDWPADGRSFVDDVVEFESRVEELWRHHDGALICTYRLERFGGDTVIAIMRTHPVVIVGSILQRNPFFAPPDHRLPEIREWRSTRRMHQCMHQCMHQSPTV
jgi:hypothetical protein